MSVFGRTVFGRTVLDERSFGPEPLTTEDIPREIAQLIELCEANVESFTNDQMSIALSFAQKAWRALAQMNTES
jgi:hypothetical protein